jgi:antitoxin (DNA-binding transcriptional repressor) of toxin-antitoxin stability system
MLDAVENGGESFVVVRRGRAIARIEPAGDGSGRAVKQLLRRAPHDPDWVAEVQRVRDAAQPEDRRWRD